MGRYSSAKAFLLAAIALEPEYAAGWFEEGVVLGKLGDFRSAEAYFRHALQLDHDLPKAHYMLGLSLIANPSSKLDWPEAIAEFRTALKIEPDYPEALNYLGVGLTATGHPDLAIAELERAVVLAPELATAHFNLAIALETGGRLEEAAKAYSKAIALKGDYAEANSALGKLLFRMGDASAAEVALRAALRLNPDMQDAHYGLGRVLRASRRPAEAKIEFDQAVALGRREPDSIESSRLSNAALALAGKGDMAGAEAGLRKAISLRPDYGVPHYNLGLILADEGRLDEAVMQLTEAISLMPGQAKPWFDLGRVQRLQGKLESAGASFAWAGVLNPSDQRVAAELKLLWPEGEPHGAAKAKQPTAGADADTALAHYAFSQQPAAQGDWLGEAGELLRSLALAPADITVRAGLARAYERLGDLERSSLEYRKALLVVPNDVEMMLALGKILLAKDRPAEANEIFGRALKLDPASEAARQGLEAASKLDKH